MRPVVALLFAGLLLSGPRAFAPPVPLPSSSLEERLHPEDYKILLKAILLTERSLAEQVQGLRGRTVSRGDAPLAAHDAVGLCGPAMETAASLLRRQGVSASRLNQFQLSGKFGLFGELSYKHVVLVFLARDRKGELVPVIVDPTFAQSNRFRGHGDLGVAKAVDNENELAPGAILAKSEPGRTILAALRQEAAWIADNDLLRVWAEAMTADAQGRPQEHKVPTLEELKAGNIALSSSIHDTASRVTKKTEAGMIAALAAIDDEQIARRTRTPPSREEKGCGQSTGALAR